MRQQNEHPHSNPTCKSPKKIVHLQVKSKISVLNRDFCFAHTSKAASLRMTREISAEAKDFFNFQLSSFNSQVSRIVNFELWITYLTRTLPLAIPLLSPCYPLAIPFLLSHKTIYKQMVRIFKFLNLLIIADSSLRNIKQFWVKKRDFYNKKILSVRFCGLFLHRNWRTRGFRKPVTVEHFQLN